MFLFKSGFIKKQEYTNELSLTFVFMYEIVVKFVYINLNTNLFNMKSLHLYD